MPNTSAPQSFIPRDAPVAAPRGVPGRGLAELLTLIALVLFVASAALAIGVFLYSQYLQSNASSKVDQLERARAAFEPSLINELTRLDDRMRAAGEVLGGHIAPSAFFRMLEQTTIQTVAFTSLDFEATDDERMNITMEGVAESVNAIALQADLFSKGGMVTSPIFSNINREFDGVHFDLSALLDPVAINYLQYVAGAMAAMQQQPEIVQPTQPSSPFGAPASPSAAETSPAPAPVAAPAPAPGTPTPAAFTPTPAPAPSPSGLPGESTDL
jgi:hypothetical protein